MACFIGIDLTCSERKASAWAALDESARILEMGAAQTDASLLDIVERLQAASIAIDSPLFLPRGFRTLDVAAAPPGLPAGRGCERDLKRIGIGCFYTTPRSIIKPMVYRGIALRDSLEQRGVTVLEVFPYASKVRLFGTRQIPKKSTRAGRDWLHQRLSAFIPDLAAIAATHDDMDALVAAYTGMLHACGGAEAVGDVDEGLLWIPSRGAGACAKSLDKRMPG